ncbi:hypothetical protein SSX86_005939 [Deinandra increscens subsp. villosa]|uniref:F-box domain-containing protein n=1 Tax=Deinandra increscens subsp. villosa TaxID=3103831 RepID=A0AAP0DRF5_9ASTR
MDGLPQPLLLQILSRLDKSADVARCRVAYKAFDAVFPGLRSINLRWSNWASINRRSFMTVLLNLISKLEIVESIRIDIVGKPIPDDGSYRLNEDFVVEWLSRVSGSLKSLSIYDLDFQFPRNLLFLISDSCHNLVNLQLRDVWLCVGNLNHMPKLTSLTLEDLYLEDEHLNEMNKCFPNLQVLKLSGVGGLQHPMIHFLNLKIFFWQDFLKGLPSLTLITPNLITLKFVCDNPPPVYIEAPMLSHFHLNAYSNADTFFMVKKFENLKTIWLRAFHIGVLLSIFPITETVETLTLDSEPHPSREFRDSEFTLGKVLAVFPNVTSMRINLGAWLELEAWLDRKSCKKRKKAKTTCQFRREGLKLKSICVDLKLVDPSVTFSAVACVLDQCAGLSNFSLIINSDVTSPVFESFRSKCMARWPGLEWRWGIRTKYTKFSWITEGSSV